MRRSLLAHRELRRASRARATEPGLEVPADLEGELPSDGQLEVEGRVDAQIVGRQRRLLVQHVDRAEPKRRVADPEVLGVPEGVGYPHVVIQGASDDGPVIELVVRIDLGEPVRSVESGVLSRRGGGTGFIIPADKESAEVRFPLD